MFESFKDASIYEEELRKVKREHFQRTNQLEDRCHELESQIKTLKVDHENEINKIESRYEVQILTLKQQIELEKSNIELIKQKSLLETEREIMTKKDEFNESHIRRIEDISGKENKTLRTVLALTASKLPGAHNLTISGDVANNLIERISGTKDEE